MPVFQPAKRVHKKMKILVWGQPGAGKTVFTLGWPKLAVIDTEHGTDMYAGRLGEFDVIRTTSMAEVITAINEAERSGKYETLAIDSITNLYEQIKAGKMNIKDGSGSSIKVPDWNIINSIMRDLYRRLAALNNVHVIVTAAETDILETTDGGGFKKIGVKPDIDKAAARMFDFSIRLIGKGEAEFYKSRGFDKFQQGTKIKKLEYATFLDMIQEVDEGERLADTEVHEEKPSDQNLSVWSANYYVVDSLGNAYMGDSDQRTLPIPKEVGLPAMIQEVIKANVGVLYAPNGYGGDEADFQAFKLPKPARVTIRKTVVDGNTERAILSIE